MDLLLYKLHYPLHLSDKQDSNLHHRPPRERTSPFGHYLRCTSFTLLFPVHLSIGLPWPLRVGSALLLLHSSLYSIYHPLYIYSFILRYPYISILSLFLLLYLYHYIIYTSILVIFTLFLYFYSLLSLSLFYFYLYYSLDPRWDSFIMHY